MYGKLGSRAGAAGLLTVHPAITVSLARLAVGAAAMRRCAPRLSAGAGALPTSVLPARPQVSLGLVLPTLLAWQLQSRMAASIAAHAAQRQDSAMLQQVRAFLEQHGNARFEDVDRVGDSHAPRVMNRAGYRQETGSAEGGD